MRKQSVFIALVLGCVLMSYQNCSNGMHADQSLQNLIDNENQNRFPDGDGGQLVAEAKAVASCNPAELKLGWPLGGRPYADYIISNYVDEDPASPGMKDYTGATGAAAKTYDGHSGVDMLMPSFRYVDNGTPVYASAPGTVSNVVQDQPDHNLTCESQSWNVVIVKHANGYKTVYGHLRKNSVLVQIGQTVTAGQKIAEVGSSGCSTYPHLHFEVRDCTNTGIDSMPGMYVNPPPLYTKIAPTTFMDAVLASPVITSTSQMTNPGSSNPTSFKQDVNFSIGMTVAAGKPGDVLRLEFVDPSGAASALYFERKLDANYNVSHWWWNLYLHQLGTWKVNFKINGTLQASRNFNIVQ
jgi:murein DD-endopeptidase MepM/ murein hydrolase activator NlpD